MSRHKQGNSDRGRVVSRMLPFVVGAAAISGAEGVRADIWYMHGASSSTNWHTTGTWWSAPGGSGGGGVQHPAGSLNSDDTYVSTGTDGTYHIRTTSGTFAGGLMVLDGGVLHTKHGGTAVTVPAFEVAAAGGRIQNSESTARAINFNSGHLDGDLAFAGQSAVIAFDTLTGGGGIIASGFNSGHGLTLTIDAGAGYTGTISLTGSRTLDFNNDLVTSGGLLVTSGAVVLDQHLTFASLTVEATEYGPGTYSFDTLAATGFFTTSGPEGSITVVPEPASLALIAVATVLIARRRGVA